MAPQKVDDAQLVPGRDVDNVDLLIHDPVAKPHKPDREVFASTAVAALPCLEQSPLVVAEDASTGVYDPPERKCILLDVDVALSGLPVLYEASLKPTSLKLLFRL